MFKRIVAVGMAAAATAAFGIGVRAETGSRLGFTVENDTGATVARLELARPASGKWRPIRLDAKTLRPGEAAAALVDGPRSRCEYDVRAVMRDGAVIRQDDVNLCDLDGDTLVFED